MNKNILGEAEPVQDGLVLPILQELPMSFHPSFSVWIALQNFFRFKMAEKLKMVEKL